MMQDAFDLALDGGDAIRAARILDKISQITIFNADVRKMIRWANKLPVDARARFPRLCIYHAWALVQELQLESTETTLALAEAHLEVPSNLSEDFSAIQIIHHATAIRVYLAFARGEYDRAVDLAHDAIASLSRDKPPDIRSLRGAIELCLGMTYIKLGQMGAAWQALQGALPLNKQTGNRYGALSCLLYLMEMEMARGKLDQAARHAEMGITWIEEWSGPKDQMGRPVRMLAGLRRLMGIVQYERNDLEQATENFHKVYNYYELVQNRLRPIISLALIDLHQALGDKEKALAYLGKLKRIILSPGLSVPDFAVAAAITERNLLLNRLRPELSNLLAEAIEWAEASNLSPGDEFRSEQEYEYCTLARVLIASDRTRDAIPLLERLIKCAEDDGRNGHLITYLSLQAVAHHAQDNKDLALTYLSQSLELGESGGYVRTFVDLGEPMRDLLQAAARQKITPAYVSGLLATFSDRDLTSISHPPVLPKSGAVEVLVEPLNEREMTILRLLSARRSYQEISEELYLSLNTIKWYTRNIYSKLGVNKKNQAAARAQELGIL
jgi:LuxR family maltose regulon positive regulatory protein